MSFKFSSIAKVVIAVLSISSVSSHALESGDFIVRLGIANVNPDVESGTLKSGGADVTLGGGTTTIDVDDNSQLGFTMSYMLDDSWAFGLLAATPFKHDISVQGGLANAGLDTIIETRHLPPTFTAQYHFPISKTVKPFVGVGLNYTRFFDTKATAGLEGAAGATDVSLDDSWGLALEAGVDFEIADDWYFNVHAWMIDINTEATLNTTNLGNLTLEADIDPVVIMLGFGKRF
ncbi:OmpW family protein [Pleionea sp. CnH1-48]|uniref:OmpW/AlkL family protein n=1 Tax=Pleionea sp. CnH1-48 TaxID=2954494 RepID=UPI0020972003|nr:OmpW family outer membrane protein [Pleionea sp. CnH1-48]MCO7224904.1 outer membrane beta-barrel protein [Pleionea sp. CnH1-48]